MHPRYTKKIDCSDWKMLVTERLHLMCEAHGIHKKVCSGIDLRMSAPFVQRDLMRSHELLDMHDTDDNLLGFAFLKTKLTSLYIALLVSCAPGVGYATLYELQRTRRFAHPAIVVRSTDKALGFYLKLKFRLFDWAGAETGFVGDGDQHLTQSLRDGAVDATRQELRRRGWLNDDEEEWPLLTVRFTECPIVNRSSARVRARRELSLLTAPAATDRTFSTEEK